MFPRRRTACIIAAGLATLWATAACGGSAQPSTSTSSTGTGLEKTHLTVGALPIVDDAPLFLAIKNGYFKQQGLTITTEIIPQSTLAIPDMLHGTVDIIGTGNYVSFFEGQAQKTFSIRVLSAGATCTQNSFGILTLPKSGIKGPAGLAGKTIAVNLTNNIQTLTADTLLKANGVNPASVKYVVVPFPDMATALKAGRVNAISVVEPFMTGAEQADGRGPGDVAMLRLSVPSAAVRLLRHRGVGRQVPPHRPCLPGGHGQGAGVRRREPQRRAEGPADLHQDHRRGGTAYQAQLLPPCAQPGAGTAGGRPDAGRWPAEDPARRAATAVPLIGR